MADQGMAALAWLWSKDDATAQARAVAPVLLMNTRRVIVFVRLVLSVFIVLVGFVVDGLLLRWKEMRFLTQWVAPTGGMPSGWTGLWRGEFGHGDVRPIWRQAKSR